jgi:hypothetical protein
MSEYVSISIRREIVEKLQRLAVLTGDESSAIERLISHWEGTNAVASKSMPAKATAEIQVWHSSSGDTLRVGEVLQATDGGKTHQATVERDGIKYKGQTYDSPSAAARAVKHLRGLRGTSASTNGRDFWKLRDPKTNRWVPISALRPTYRIDADALLAELTAQK